MENNSGENITEIATGTLRTNVPLVVDLDGTLINTDLLHEGILLLLKKNALYLFSCFAWILKGKAYFKNKLFSIVSVNYELLPYNTGLLDFLQSEHGKGKRLILATASPSKCAHEISKLIPIFNEIYGTESINLKGRNKLNLLINRFGYFRFDYVGNSNSDLIIFASSRHSYLVNPGKSLESKVKKVSHLQDIWASKKMDFLNFIKAIRAYQWIKNVLIFIPLITSHSFDTTSFVNSMIGFIAFSLVASSGYLINDLLDLESDRAHLHKQNRLVASGKISISVASFLSLILLSAGLILATLINFHFLITLFCYFIISIAYSIYLKKIALYDVFILALLYSIRIIAGAIAIGVLLSSWLIAFSTFLFLSLALLKRHSELIQVKDVPAQVNKGRQYSVDDLHLLQTMGIVSGFLSVVVFSLYIDSPEVVLLYSKPKVLWIISFLFLFWISRMWLVTSHGKMTDDPIIFAIKDRLSYFIFFIIAVILFYSI